ncbi:hypothetical protein EYF80_004326 [Liparis tanakae]|uniref:Uncharacterized protein n=1 Tax=Liparis tanakae TaxID=230148 RepID=A0A4Z2J613_9TELE|nr:hypothetical protein EYF80_004326 [Liparis tanakae]
MEDNTGITDLRDEAEPLDGHRLRTKASVLRKPNGPMQRPLLSGDPLVRLRRSVCSRRARLISAFFIKPGAE